MPQHVSRTARLNAACGHLLALGVVAVLAAPATTVLDMRIVEPPGSGGPVGEGTAHSVVGAGAVDATVAAAPVDPSVREEPVPRAGAHARVALSAAEPVTGLGTVGVTWDRGRVVPDGTITVTLRTRSHGTWSAWQPVPYHDDHGPDPDSPEGRNARPGTDPVYVGAVDDVQVRAVTSAGAVPAGLEVAVVDPGAAVPRVEKPAIDTAALSAATTSAGTDVTPKPQIFSRAQWGADESLRDASQLRYYEVHAGFVHHTVDTNDYTADQVPAIIRGIYAFHTRSRGWSDIGYNFLVDRFGRVWEGRYGGVDRPVVGAHTFDYNEHAFAMAAIGNYDIEDGGRGLPSQAMLDAYGRLFAWKLSLHGVNAASMRQWVRTKYLPAINGHRDVGDTACPGRYLYAKLAEIRALARADQHAWAGRDRHTDLVGSRWPDLVVRDRATGKASFVQTGGQLGFGAPTVLATGWSGKDLVAAVSDVTGDGRADVMARDKATGRTGIFPGDAAGHLGSALRSTTRFAGADVLVGVGDWNRDGRDDLVGRVRATHRLLLYPGAGAGTFGPSRVLSTDGSGYDLAAAAGDLTGDGRPDLVARAGSRLSLLASTASGGLAAPVTLPGSWSGFDAVAGLGDLTNDGRADLVARKASTGATYLYPGDGAGRLGAAQGPFTAMAGSRFLAGSGTLAGSGARDLVAVDGAGRLVAWANNGRRNVVRTVPTGQSFPGTNLVLGVGDWDGDGHGDVVTRTTGGGMVLWPGDGTGRLSTALPMASGWGSVRLVAAVGDITGDGHPDLMGQPSGGPMRIYPGNGAHGFLAGYVAHSAVAGNLQVGIGRWDTDGSPDTLVRRSDGTLALYPGNGPGGLTGSGSTTVASGTSQYDALTGVGDANGDGHPDVVARQATTGTLWLLPGTATGRLGARRMLAPGFAGYDLLG